MRYLILAAALCFATIALAQVVTDGNGDSLGRTRRNYIVDQSNGGDVVGKHGVFVMTPNPTATPLPTSTPTPTP